MEIQPENFGNVLKPCEPLNRNRLLTDLAGVTHDEGKTFDQLGILFLSTDALNAPIPDPRKNQNGKTPRISISKRFKSN